MISQNDAEKAKIQVINVLNKIFGSSLEGIVALGIRFDIQTRDIFIGIDVDPSIPLDKVANIPTHIFNVPVRVHRRNPPEMETSEK